MCLFIETIRIENGVINHLDYHNERLNRTRAAFFHQLAPLNLVDYLRPPLEEGTFKCRVAYDHSVREVTYAPYLMRPVASLRLVVSDAIDYSYKSSDREALNRLFSQRGEADDVLIVRKQLLTDTSIANIALYDGRAWYTPEHPLLKGTQRAALLHRKLLQEADICVEQLFTYSHLALFNAMIDFGKIIIPICRESIVL